MSRSNNIANSPGFDRNPSKKPSFNVQIPVSMHCVYIK